VRLLKAVAVGAVIINVQWRFQAVRIVDTPSRIYEDLIKKAKAKFRRENRFWRDANPFGMCLILKVINC
jgi:hypothetical protein